APGARQLPSRRDPDQLYRRPLDARDRSAQARERESRGNEHFSGARGARRGPRHGGGRGQGLPAHPALSTLGRHPRMELGTGVRGRGRSGSRLSRLHALPRWKRGGHRGRGLPGDRAASRPAGGGRLAGGAEALEDGIAGFHYRRRDADRGPARHRGPATGAADRCGDFVVRHLRPPLQHPPDHARGGAPVRGRAGAPRAGTEARGIMSDQRIAVIGAGSWGTALANLLAKKGLQTVLWSYEREVAEAIRLEHRNPRYLSEVVLDPSLQVTDSIPEAVRGASIVVSVSPSHVVRAVMGEAAPYIEEGALVVS